jgi:hypothetical protein
VGERALSIRHPRGELRIKIDPKLPRRKMTQHQLEWLRAVLARSPKDQRCYLQRLMGELLDLHDSFVPLPQTNPAQLILNLAARPPEDWQEILANEVLLYLGSAYRAGHQQAVVDAREWCRTYSLPVPDWLRDAPDRIKRRGRRSPETSLKTFYTDLARFIAVELANKQTDGVGDKFYRARDLLKDGFAYNPDPHANNSTKAIEKSYDKFTMRFDSSYYFPPVLLLNWMRDGVWLVLPAEFEPLAPLLWTLLYIPPAQ